LTVPTIQSFLQGYLGDLYNLFIVKCGIVENTQRGVIEVSVVFYKYIQRARVVKSRRMALLIASGAIESKPPIYHIRLAQGFMVPNAMISRVEALLQSVFGKPFSITFFNISQLAELTRTKANHNLTHSLDQFMRGKQKAIDRSHGKRS